MSNVQATELPEIGYTTSIPDSSRGGWRGTGENPYKALMQKMPAPKPSGKGKDAQMQYAWFFVEAEPVADTITDPKERDKQTKANQQKLVNKFTSIGRRIRKEDQTFDFTYRKMADPRENSEGKPGLVVYRIVADAG